MKKLIIILITLCMIIPTSVFAENEKPDENISELTLNTKSILLKEKNTADELFDKNG